MPQWLLIYFLPYIFSNIYAKLYYYILNMIEEHITSYIYYIFFHFIKIAQEKGILFACNTLICCLYYLIHIYIYSIVKFYIFAACIYSTIDNSLVLNIILNLRDLSVIFFCIIYFSFWFINNITLKHLYPSSHKIINIVLILLLVLIGCCLVDNVLDLVFTTVSHIFDLILNFVLKMMANPLPPSNPDPMPAGGGGEDPWQPGNGGGGGRPPEDAPNRNDPSDKDEDDNDSSPPSRGEADSEVNESDNSQNVEQTRSNQESNIDPRLLSWEASTNLTPDQKMAGNLRPKSPKKPLTEDDTKPLSKRDAQKLAKSIRERNKRANRTDAEKLADSAKIKGYYDNLTPDVKLARYLQSKINWANQTDEVKLAIKLKRKKTRDEKKQRDKEKERELPK